MGTRKKRNNDDEDGEDDSESDEVMTSLEIVVVERDREEENENKNNEKTTASAVTDEKKKKKKKNERRRPIVLSITHNQTGDIDPKYKFTVYQGVKDTSDKELREEFGEDVYDRVYDFENGDTPHSENHLIVVGKGEGCDLVGKNFAHEMCGFGAGTMPVNESDGYIGNEGRAMDVLGRLVKKVGGKKGEYVLKLQRIAGDAVVQMTTRPHGYNYNFVRKDEEKVDYNNIDVRRAMNAETTRLFSSQKRQRQQQKLLAARKLDQAAIASPKEIESQIGKSSRFALTRKELMQKAGEQRNLPAHDLEATKPHKAFPWKSTPGYALFQSYLPHDLYAKAAKKKTQEDKIAALGGSDKPVAIMDLLPMINEVDPSWAIHEGDPEFDAREKAKALAFMDALLQFASMKNGRVKEARPRKKEKKKRKLDENNNGSDDGVKKEEDDEIVEEEEEKEEGEEVKHKWLFTTPDKLDPMIQVCIIETFTEIEIGDDTQFGASRIRTKPLKDLCILHIVLLALRIANWKVNAEPIRAALKMKPTEFTQVYRQLGAKKVQSIKHKKDESPTIELMMGERQLLTILPEIKNRVQAQKKKD
jgi:hypothetical protein